MYDFLIIGGTVVDGTGAERITADVGIKDGKIAAIGTLKGEAAKETIDATGKIVAPGFIDYHSHSDLTILMRFGAQNMLEQGITTEVAGHCGHSISPLIPPDFAAIQSKIAPDAQERLDKTDGSTKAVMAEIERQLLPTNFAYYLGHGAIRGKVMGYEDRKPTADEMAKMKEYICEGMEAGAMGFSTGLIYPPGSYSDTEELIELCKVVAEYGGHYTTHMRSEGNKVVQSVEEALRIGKECNVPVIISHKKIFGKHNEKKSEQTLALAEQARKTGQKVYFDQYPYDGGATSLFSGLPPSYASQGIDRLAENLKDKKVRAELAELLSKDSNDFENLIFLSTPDGVIVSGIEAEPELNGMTLAEIARQKNNDVYETLFDLLIENRELMAIFRMINPWDIDNIMKSPYTMGGTDAAQYPREEMKKTHPRFIGTFPKIIGQYCREKGLFSLEECIRKLTLLPAQVAGFTQKGQLAQGKDADIVVFDYDKIDGKSTYGNIVPNDGIDYVFVNGVLAVKDGVCTGNNGGTLLRRTPSVK